MLGLLSLTGLIATDALLAWCSVRAWRIKNAIFKWGGTGLAGLLAVAVLLVAAFMINGLFRLGSRSAAAFNIKVAATPSQIERGQAISDSFCGACHSRTGILTGGVDIGKDLPIRVGSFVSANLTPAGDLKHWSDGEIFRAIRNGIAANGRWLMIMSYTNAGRLSDDDIEAVIAYIRSRPAAGELTPDPPDRLNPLGLIMLGAGLLPRGKPILSGAITAPPKSASARYGEYILSYQDCRECHGADLTGGIQGQLAPVGPGLDIVKNWKPAEFISTMRTGVDPTGHELGKQMPWRPIGRMDDEELTAIYEYLVHLRG
jgi:mono/diheme cytochrome c family protein